MSCLVRNSHIHSIDAPEAVCEVRNGNMYIDRKRQQALKQTSKGNCVSRLSTTVEKLHREGG